MLRLEDRGLAKRVDQGFSQNCEVLGIWFETGLGLGCGSGVLLCWGDYPSSMPTTLIETELELAGG